VKVVGDMAKSSVDVYTMKSCPQKYNIQLVFISLGIYFSNKLF